MRLERRTLGDCRPSDVARQMESPRWILGFPRDSTGTDGDF